MISKLIILIPWMPNFSTAWTSACACASFLDPSCYGWNLTEGRDGNLVI